MAIAYDRQRSPSRTPANPNPAPPPSFLGVTPTSSLMLSPALLSSPLLLSPSALGRLELCKRKSFCLLSPAASPRRPQVPDPAGPARRAPATRSARCTRCSPGSCATARTARRAARPSSAACAQAASAARSGALLSLLCMLFACSCGCDCKAGARRLVRKAPSAPPSASLPYVPALPSLPSFPSTSLSSPGAGTLLSPAPVLLSADGIGAGASAPLAYANPFAPARGPALRLPLARRAQTDLVALPIAASATNLASSWHG
jgi:hypothetical protein